MSAVSNMMSQGYHYTSRLLDIGGKIRTGISILTATGVLAPIAWNQSKPYIASAASSLATAAKTTALFGGALACVAGGYAAANYVADKTNLNGGDGLNLYFNRGWSERTIQRLHTCAPAAIMAVSLVPLAYAGSSIF